MIANFIVQALPIDYLKHLPKDSKDRLNSESNNCCADCLIRIYLMPYIKGILNPWEWCKSCNEQAMHF